MSLIKQKNEAILFVILAVLLLSCHDLTGKILSQHYSIIVILWFRYLFHFLFAGLNLKFKIEHSHFKKIHCLRALLMSLIGISFITGLKYIPLAEATAINFLSPLFVLLLSKVFLKEKISVENTIKIVCGFLGILIIARPSGDIFKPEILFPILAATFFAIYQVLSRVVSVQEKPLISNFYLGFYAFLMMSVVLPFFWVNIHLADLILFLMIGMFGTFAHTLFNQAYTLQSPALLSPFTYFQIVFATILGFIFFHRIPDGLSLFGVFIILLSGFNLKKFIFRS